MTWQSVTRDMSDIHIVSMLWFSSFGGFTTTQQSMTMSMMIVTMTTMTMTFVIDFIVIVTITMTIESMIDNDNSYYFLTN